MLRTTTTSTTAAAAALLGLALLAPTSAGAAGETCQGVPATHVGSATVYELEGTEGPDVIVTNGAAHVAALGGNDLICVTEFANRVLAGSGDDEVHSFATDQSGARIELGPGSDRFTGTSANDMVWGGDKVGQGHADADRDVIDGGPASADDGDYVMSGQPGTPNPDEVRIVGGMVELLGAPTAQTLLDGGAGSALHLDSTDARSVAIDPGAGSYSRDDDTTSLAGFDEFVVTDQDGPRYLSFRGSDLSETLTMDLTLNPAYDVDMGGGDDEVVLTTDRIHRRVTTFDGGSGRDLLGIVMPGKRDVRLDLRRGRLLAGDAQRAVAARTVRFEDAEVVAQRIELVGTGSDNDLRADGCEVEVRALSGGDTFSPVSRQLPGRVRCGAKRARIEGGTGPDVLRGTGGADVLVGGPGRDVADGRSGRDVCSAEKMRGCEVRR